MRRRLAALLLGLSLLVSSAQAVTVTLDGALLPLEQAPFYYDITYVPLRAMVDYLLPGAQISWTGSQAVVNAQGLCLTATPGEAALICNGAALPLPGPILLEQGRTLIPLRTLASLLGLEIGWDPGSRTASLTTPGTAGPAWTEDDLYWLSRIISAEAQGESWEGKIAVGNVVLNRVASDQFPDTIYDVIFDDRWGGQFEPVRNGTIYNMPTEESVQAAVACLNGENNVGDSLYFLAPSLTSNHWTMANRAYVTTIGVHWFYR